MKDSRALLYDCIEDKLKTTIDDAAVLEKYDQQAFKRGEISMAEHYQVTVVSTLLRKTVDALKACRHSLDQIPAE